MEILKQQQLLKSHNPSPEKKTLWYQILLPFLSKLSSSLTWRNQFSKTDSLNRICVRMVLSATKKTTVRQNSPATNVISLDLFSHEE
jgi:hypothetical protein